MEGKLLFGESFFAVLGFCLTTELKGVGRQQQYNDFVLSTHKSVNA